MTSPSLVAVVSSAALAPDLGVAIVDAGARPQITLTPNQTVGLIMPTAWGPEGAWVRVGSWKELHETFFPFGIADHLSSYGPIAGMPFQDLYVYRVVGSGSAKASYTFVDDDTPTGENSLVVTAKYDGNVDIKATVSANADDGTKRDVRIYQTGPSGQVVYDKTYYAIQNANGSVNAIADVETSNDEPDLVTFAAASGAGEAAKAGSGTLTGGSDGTIAAANFSAALSIIGGLNTPVGIVVPVGVASGIRAAVNAAFTTWAGSASAFGCLAVLNGGQTTRANAIADAPTYRAQRVRYVNGNVTRVVTYSNRGVTLQTTQSVSPHAIFAFQRSVTDPRVPAAGGRLQGFSGVAVGLDGTFYGGMSGSDVNALRAAGVITYKLDTDTGALVPYDDVANYIDPSTGKVQFGEYVLTTDFYDRAHARFASQYIHTLADVNLSRRTLGPNLGAFHAAMTQFFDEQVATGYVSEFVTDPFGLNSDADLAVGRYTYGYTVRLTAHLRSVVLQRGYQFTAIS
jgi:hypothetical protein